MLRFSAPALAALLAATAAASAAGPNGGRTTIVDGHPIELVGTDTALTFFVTDEDGKPVDTAGLTAKAFVQVADRTETVVLKGAAPNRFVGPLSAPLAPGAKVVLSARFHGHTLQARFAP